VHTHPFDASRRNNTVAVGGKSCALIYLTPESPERYTFSYQFPGLEAIMQLSTIFSRANQQKYLLPSERAVYRLIVFLLILIPPAALLGGLETLLTSLHASLPVWAWPILIAVLPPVLLAIAKFFSAKGDTVVSSVIQGLETGVVSDIAANRITTLGTNATVPRPMVSGPPAANMPNVPPRTGARDQPPRT